MHFFIYLPVAGNAVNIVLLISLGGLVGFMSGLFGVGGGFLMTPLLIMIGIPPTVAAASDSNQIVAASSSGMYAHARAGSVDFKMGVLLLFGGVAGGSVGVLLIKLLRALGNADFVITLTYVVMLGGIGSYMFFESLGSLRGSLRRGRSPGQPSRYARLVEGLPWKVAFERSRVRLSVLMPLGLGVMVGVLAAIMGVGGGFIMVPVMVYLLRMPMHVVVGTSLFQILFTCINVTVLQAKVNHTVDFVLALLLLIGSVIGAQIGARLSTRLQADQLKILMAIMVPVMVYLLRMPMHVVVGTSLFQILFTCINVTILQAKVNHTVDFVLALLLLIGSVIGAQIGARLSTRLQADQLKILMAIIVLVVTVKMLLGLLLAPDVLVAYAGGH